MTEYAFERSAVAAKIAGADVVWIDGDPAELWRLPSEWRAIGTADSAEERKQLAMARWSAEFLARIPRFARLLRERLVDVAPAMIGGEPMLVYVTTDGDTYAPWLGTDPHDFGAESLVWHSLPVELQSFQRDTHPGWGLAAPGLYGIRRPAEQVSRYERLNLAELDVAPADAIVGEHHGEPVREDEVYLLSFDEAQAYYCVSPRFEVGEIAFIYYNDFDIADLWQSLDEVMVMHYRNVVY